jgi:hypothetical protein
MTFAAINAMNCSYYLPERLSWQPNSALQIKSKTHSVKKAPDILAGASSLLSVSEIS